MKKLTIVGGGITGLAAAYLAARSGWRVTVLEASSEMGGLLATFPAGGSRLEYFYHHAFTHDVELRWLLQELGIENRMVYRRGTMGVIRGGRTYSFNGPADLLRFKPMGLVDKGRFAMSSLYLGRFARWQDYEHVPALDWFNQMAGRQVTESVWEPLLRVKFGPYFNQIPLAWMIGRLRQRLQSRRGSEEKLGYMDGSLHMLLEALLMALKEKQVQLITNAPVKNLTMRDGELASVQTPAGEFDGDAFLFTIPTTHLADLVRPASEAYSDELRRIEYFGAVCMVLELNRPLSQFYWLNIADPGFPFGGIIEHTNLIPPEHYQGRHWVYLSRYFATSDDLARMSVNDTQKLMLEGLKRIYPSLKGSEILSMRVFSSRTAAVVCDLNFSKKIPACRSPLKRLFVASMPHLYPDERSCNNSMRVAAQACKVMGMDTSAVPQGISLAGRLNMD